MIENEGDSVLTLYPGQQLNTDASLDFASYSFYTQSIANTGNLTIIERQQDPFSSVGEVAGFAYKINAATVQGVIAVFYRIAQVEQLLAPVLNVTESLSYFVLQLPNTTLVENVPQAGILTQQSIDYLASDDSLSSRELAKDIRLENGGYVLAPVEYTGKSSASYKMVRLFSSFSTVSSNVDDYEFMVIVLQEQAVFSVYSLNLEDDINSQYFWLLLIVIGASVVLFVLIFACALCFTRKITKPIQVLTDLTQSIKKDLSQHEIQEQIAKYPMFSTVRKMDPQDMNEIQELTKIFLDFFVEDHAIESEGEEQKQVLRDDYEYPKNVYFNKRRGRAAAEKKADKSDEGEGEEQKTEDALVTGDITVDFNSAL